MKPNLSIDEVVQRTGLTAHTLRYYERIGLIAPVGRAPGGQRRYAAADLAWIDFLLRLRTTHMPVGKMLAFAALRGAGDGTVSERRLMLEQHLATVLAEMEAMRQSVAALQAKLQHYRVLEQSLASVSPLKERPNHDDTSRPQPLRPRTRKAPRD